MKNELNGLEKKARESAIGLGLNNGPARREYTVGPDGFVVPEPIRRIDKYSTDEARYFSREHHYGVHT